MLWLYCVCTCVYTEGAVPGLSFPSTLPKRLYGLYAAKQTFARRAWEVSVCVFAYELYQRMLVWLEYINVCVNMCDYMLVSFWRMRRCQLPPPCTGRTHRNCHRQCRSAFTRHHWTRSYKHRGRSVCHWLSRQW